MLWKSIYAFAVGAVLMILLSFTVYRKSYYYKMAEAEMQVAAQKPGILSRLVTALILLTMILYFALVDLWVTSGGPAGFDFLVLYNLVLVALLSLFDALFIDIFLLLVWRPAFWRLPEGQPTLAKMMQHIKLQFTKGWLFKLPIAVLAAGTAVLVGAGVE